MRYGPTTTYCLLFILQSFFVIRSLCRTRFNVVYHNDQGRWSGSHHPASTNSHVHCHEVGRLYTLYCWGADRVFGPSYDPSWVVSPLSNFENPWPVDTSVYTHNVSLDWIFVRV